MNKPQQPEWFVYMIRADDHTLYSITTNLERRLKQHQNGKGGAKYFRGRCAVKLCSLNLGTVAVAQQSARRR